MISKNKFVIFVIFIIFIILLFIIFLINLRLKQILSISNSPCNSLVNGNICGGSIISDNSVTLETFDTSNTTNFNVLNMNSKLYGLSGNLNNYLYLNSDYSISFTANGNTYNIKFPNIFNNLNNTPGNNTPGNNTPENNTPGNNTPGNNTRINNTPGNNTRVNNTRINNTPRNNTPGNNTPGNNTPDYVPFPVMISESNTPVGSSTIEFVKIISYIKDPPYKTTYINNDINSDIFVSSAVPNIFYNLKITMNSWGLTFSNENDINFIIGTCPQSICKNITYTSLVYDDINLNVYLTTNDINKKLYLCIGHLYIK